MRLDQTKAMHVGIVAMLLGCVVGIAVPAGLGWDFANFYDAGHKALVGQVGDLYDPRAEIAGGAAQGTMTFWSVPLASYLFVPLALLPPEVALVVFKLENTAALLAALYVLYRLAMPFVPANTNERQRFTTTYVWLALLFQPLWTVFRVGGQTTPTVLLLLAVGLVYHVRERWWISSLCYVVALILKPAFAPGLIFLALVSGWSFFAAAATWGLGLAGFAIALMGWGVHQAFIDQILGVGVRSTAWMYNSALTVPLENLRMLSIPGETASSRPAGLAIALQTVRIAIVGLFAWLAWHARALRAPGRRHAAFQLSVLFALLSGPVIWEHYLALLFIPLSYLLAVRTHLGRAAQKAMAGIFVLALFQNLILVLWVRDHFDIESGAGLLAIGLVKAAPLMLTLALLVPMSGRLLGSYGHPAWDRMAAELRETSA